MVEAVSASRRFVFIAAIAAAVVGLAGLLFALFGPTGESISCSTDGACSPVEHPSMFHEGIDPRAWAFIVVVAILILSVPASAAGYFRTGKPRFRRWLWVATVLLLVASGVSGLTIGFFFFPAVLLALLASAVALKA